MNLKASDQVQFFKVAQIMYDGHSLFDLENSEKLQEFIIARRHMELK